MVTVTHSKSESEQCVKQPLALTHVANKWVGRPAALRRQADVLTRYVCLQ